MDPNTALAVLRRLARDVEVAGDYEPWAEHFTALDEWLRTGGLLPAAWAEASSLKSDRDAARRSRS